MLTFLRVRDLAIIDALEIELGPGLNVITGETGAGKSILIDALSLVLGERGRSELVRTGAPEAAVEALFDLSDDEPARARLEASGLSPDPELLARRVVKAGGRTRAYLNGSLATARQLSEHVAELVDISSQHEHHTLVDPATHLEYLDAFGELRGPRQAVADAHAALREVEDRRRAAEAALEERGQREDLLRFQIGEIDQLAPQPDELETLEHEWDRLRHAERLTTASGGAEEALYAADGSVTERLGKLAHDLRGAAALDGALTPMAEMVESAMTQLEEAARELGAYSRDMTLDPARLAEVEERRVRLKRLARKYGGDLAGALAFREEAAEQLGALDQAEERLEALEAQTAAVFERAAEAARALSEARAAIADDLGTRISAQLESLGMGGARVEVKVAPLAERRGELTVDGARLSETGIDRVEFLIAPNPGEEPRALSKIASGGELSRAMLAIKRVLAGVGRAGLYVFDEVDSGVGGGVAEVIGQKLADVARHHQVLCITHLAQIAAYADKHFRVSKEVEGERTRSRIEPLGEKERLEELARMVGGIEITKKTRGAAEELLAGARAALGRA
ncbi:MAG: DNA repair protein RecN [Sandaracinaceae bacterium]